jgi:hypothetical protein
VATLRGCNTIYTRCSKIKRYTPNAIKYMEDVVKLMENPPPEFY